MADNLATFMCRMSRNSGTLKLMEPKGHVQGLLYLIFRTRRLLYVREAP